MHGHEQWPANLAKLLCGTVFFTFLSSQPAKVSSGLGVALCGRFPLETARAGRVRALEVARPSHRTNSLSKHEPFPSRASPA